MDAKSEAVMKSSSSTVASETSTSKSSTSVVVSKKAISSEKVVASKLITSGMGVGIVDAIEAVGSGGDSGSLLQAADQSIISLPGATDVLSGRMSNLVLAEELNANEAIKSTSLASSIKESSTASSAVLVEDQNAQTTTATTTNDKPKVEDQVDSAEKATAAATESAANTKQAELNNQIKDIISDIDSNIKEEENIAHLKQQELALLKKQQELAKQIEQQQLLANQLAAQNQLKQQELQQQQYRLSQQQQLPQQQPQQQQLYGDRVSQLPRPQTELLSQSLPPQTKSSSYETYEESQNENGFTRKSFKSEESSNVSKTIDLRKIFTPATDAPEIVPKNRKLYASSAFYSPSLHPTVEDQVELARRISHSLSDISNHTSKGQSMYVNRKKRSVKWVHEGSGQEEDDLDYEEDPQASKENTNRENQGDQPSLEKLPLKLVMNPRGQMRDYNSVSDSLNIETGLLSPDNCAELISALQLQKGRGAELFAKRRRKAENWVVDETNAGTQSPSGLPDYQQYQPKPPTSPNLLPAYSDAGKHRVQLNLHQEQMIDKYAKPGLKVVKSPWEAALETGSASAAFVEDTKLRSHTPTPSIGGAYSPAPAPQFSDSHGYGAQPHSFAPTQSAATPYGGSSYQQPAPALNKLPQANQYQHSRPAPVNPQRELAYKPSIAQGWKAPGVELPRACHHEHQQLSEYQHEEHVDTDIRSDTMVECFNQTTTNEASAIPYVMPTNGAGAQMIHVNLNQHENRQQEEQLHDQRAPNDDEPTKQRKIDVQKQLQEFEAYQERIAQQEERERIILERREKGRKQRQERRKQQAVSTTPAASVPVNRVLDECQIQNTSAHEDAKSQSKTEPGEDLYVQVAVRDLISSFEKQSLAEAEYALKQEQSNTSINRQAEQPTCAEYEAAAAFAMERHEENNLPWENSTLGSEGLYVPKEIPLDSYAPPPAVSSTQQNYGSPSWNSGSNIGQSQPWQQQQQQQVSSAAFPKESTPYIPPSGNSYAPPSGNSYAPPSGNSYAPPSGNSYAPPSGNSYTPASNVGFPLSKPVQSGGFSSSVPPKQQLYGPTSYQKVAPTTSQGAPPVSFNPSPIPYEKLSKFENPDPSPRGNGLYSPQRHLNVRGSSRVRNLSPAPFGARSPVSYGSPAAQSYSPRPSSTQQQYGSPYEGGYDTGAPAQSGFSSANYAQGPTFNSTARGWGGVGGAGHNQQRFSQPKPAIASAGGLPYSDF